MRQALKTSGVLLGLTLLAAAGLAFWRGAELALEFLAGYVIELSLSFDNVFAIALIFDYFAVPDLQRPRVLRWGVFGAVAMRGLMIFAGAALVQSFHWLLYLLGGFLIFTAVKWGFSKQALVQPENNPVVRWVRGFFRVTPGFEGANFFGVVGGRRALTPLALALVMVETTDIIFAVDSVPAIFAVTQNPLVIFSSNVFAILGLRSLYFVVVGAMQYFRYLKPGLACVLAFVGAKMIASHWWSLPTVWSLAGVGFILAVAVTLSVLRTENKSR